MPKIVDHEQYRKELLSKCFDLFAQKGYSAITMREIAKGLEVSTGTLYHYFPSKQALFEQLLEEISQQDVATALAELGGRKPLPQAMAALARYLVKNEDYFIKWTCIWVDFYQHKDSEQIKVSGVLQRANQRYQKAACDFLGVEDPVLASFVLSFVNGLILEKLWGNDLIDFDEQCALLGKILTVYLQQSVEHNLSEERQKAEGRRQKAEEEKKLFLL